jgi:hypothetical protein
MNAQPAHQTNKTVKHAPDVILIKAPTTKKLWRNISKSKEINK